MVQAIQEWPDKILTFLDKCQCENHKKSEEFVDPESEFVVHDAELQVMEKIFEVEVQESEAKTMEENTNVEYADGIHDGLLEEPVTSIDECSIAATVCDQPFDEVLAPV